MIDLFNIVKDAMRYRILRTRQDGGIPCPGVPFVAGWHINDDETFRGDQFYAYGRELDDNVDAILFGDSEADPVGDTYDALVKAISESQDCVPLPSGTATIEFQSWNFGDREKTLYQILCQIEVMSASFTTDKCRIRGVYLETKGPFTEGETFGNKDTTLTLDILKVITQSLIDL